MITSRFTDQAELNAVYQNYVAAYRQKFPNIKHWPLLNGYQVIRAVDGAGVIYTAETVLFGRQSELAKRSDVARSLAQRMLDGAAYFLAQHLAIEEVPDTLRISMAICQGNAHWTGAEVTVQGFKQIYADLLEYCNRKHINLDMLKGLQSNLRLNDARNIIYDSLGLVLARPKGGQKIATENDKMLAITEFFARGSKLPIKHFDSMNSNGYHQAVLAGLSLIGKFVTFQPTRCSNQSGNTCGDHATINLFASGVLQVIPSINVGFRPNLRSSDLRNMTNSVANQVWNVEVARAIIEKLPATQKDVTYQSNIGSYEQDRRAEDVAIKVKKLIFDLAETECVDVVNTIRETVCASGQEKLKSPSLADSRVLSKPQQKIIDEFVDLISGKHAIYNEMKLTEEDKAVYGVYARILVEDSCEDIEAKEKADKKRNSPNKKTGLLSKIVFAGKNKQPDSSKDMSSGKDKLGALPATNAKVVDPNLAILDGIIKKLKTSFSQSHSSHDANQQLEQTLEAFCADQAEKECILAAVEDNPDGLNDENILRIILLYQFKGKKMGAIENLNNFMTQAIYANKLQNFHQQAITTIISKRSPEEKNLLLRESAKNEFKHLEPGLRVLADVLMVISSFFLVGLGIGICRVATGKAWFFSSNSTVKQLEKQVISVKLS